MFRQRTDILHLPKRLCTPISMVDTDDVKRTPLQRRTPLKRTRIKPVSDKAKAKAATWKKVRKEVIERDQRLCRLCDIEGRRTPCLDVHHILYRSQGGADVRDNLISLCRECHDRAHLTSSPRLWRPILQALVEASEAGALLRRP